MDSKEIAIKRLTEKLQEESSSIVDNKDLSTRDKATQLSIVLDMVKFLKNYDKNVEILNKYYYDNKYEHYQEER